MSLLICSSAQEKYNVKIQNVTDGTTTITQKNQLGIQDPANFTNNINPVFTIKPNSEVALKGATYTRKGEIKIGQNESFSFYVGQELRARWAIAGPTSLYQSGSMPIPIPLQPGTYNMRTFTTMINEELDRCVSLPDITGNIWVEPANSQDDTLHLYGGLVLNMDHGYNALYNSEIRLTNSVPYLDTSTHYAWTFPLDVPTYTAGGGATGVMSNLSILTDAPLSLRGGVMTWDTSACDEGWAVGLTRPMIVDGGDAPRGQPRNFFKETDDSWTATAGGDDNGVMPFFDYVVRYSKVNDEITLWHAVSEDEAMVMREVLYYDNTNTDFTPNLSSYGVDHSKMYSGARFVPAGAGTVTSVSITVSGEDTTVQITDDGTDYVLTDSRLCITGNAVVTAQVPTRERFFKPVGITCHALYPKVGVEGAANVLTLNTYNCPVLESDPDTIVDYKYMQVTGGDHPAGSSFWGRSQTDADMDTRIIASMVDQSEPYLSNGSTDTPPTQRQYMGLSGPTGATPPVREGYGRPIIPTTAVDVGIGCPAWGIGLILVPSVKGIGDYKTPGVYSSATSDVSDMFGLTDQTSIFRGRDGRCYIQTDRPLETDVTAPTNTVGAFYGWYTGSHVTPIYSGGNFFVSVPQLTHTSFNMGKGIPTKIIASIPTSLRDTNEGEVFFEPGSMTYLDLNNTEEIHLNDLTIEIMDKTQQIVTDLDRSTTIILHFREKK